MLKLNKEVKPSTKPHCLSAGTHSLLLVVQAYNRNSKLHKHTNCTIALQENYFPTPLRHTENTSSTETEQLHICRVLNFTRQNLMWIKPA